MSNTKHTPGPWVRCLSMNGKEAITSEVTLYNVCLINKFKDEEWEANAKLIAAAPETTERLIATTLFLTELRKVLNLDSEPSLEALMTIHINANEAAIKKATS